MTETVWRRMGHNSSVAANLKPERRKQLFIEMQSSAQTVKAPSLILSRLTGLAAKLIAL
ncbi:MAG: hypothetical protein QNJ41_10370 [Xenococcaceae cyanobacterium MO_188.B32]|nr:hypothetical protein [Xenococcaceae cyanobacterium MO_188.B32]